MTRSEERMSSITDDYCQFCGLAHDLTASCEAPPLRIEGSDPQTDDPRAVLRWIFQRSRQGCFSRKRSERDAALADINRYTEKFA